MAVEFDPEKRAQTLMLRGLDFARAEEVFAGKHFNEEDKRRDYHEQRFWTVGMLDERLVVIVWTPRQHEQVRRIISMRKANEREQKRYHDNLG